MKNQYEIRYQLRTFTVHESKPPKENPRFGFSMKSPKDSFHYAKGIYATLDADKEHFAL